MDPERSTTTSPPTDDRAAGARPEPTLRQRLSGAWLDFRRHVGISARLILGFSLLLVLGIATASLVFVHKSRETLSDVLGEQAKQLSQTLAMASQTPYLANDTDELHRLGKDLLKNRNIVLVAFFNPQGESVAFASRDPDFSPAQLAYLKPGASSLLMQVHARDLESLGEFLEVTVPVMQIGRNRAVAASSHAPARLLGYVTVGLSQAHDQARLNRVSAMGVMVGCVILIILVPGVLALVQWILKPVRLLAAAANRIAAGDYDVYVESHRLDEIGTMARSFNEMIRQVRQKQRELQEANQSLALANRDLEERVHQRTRELENTNKRLSSEIAEKEDFLRAVSHDLNAPLRNISGMASMLLMKHRDKFDADVIHRLERIQKNVEMETDLIGELLELSRIKTRRQKVERFDLDALVREVADLFEDDLKQQNITINYDSKLPELFGERARFRQVFQNLIDNAIKYMGDGTTRQIGIGCHVSRDEVEFYVRDTGVGIEPDDLQKVFYVFRRGKKTAAKIPGKGVGLASVKSIVETYDGRIWVESTPGQGTTFRFTVSRRFVPALGGTGEPEQRETSGDGNVAAMAA